MSKDITLQARIMECSEDDIWKLFRNFFSSDKSQIPIYIKVHTTIGWSYKDPKYQRAIDFITTGNIYLRGSEENIGEVETIEFQTGILVKFHRIQNKYREKVKQLIQLIIQQAQIVGFNAENEIFELYGQTEKQPKSSKSLDEQYSPQQRTVEKLLQLIEFRLERIKGNNPATWTFACRQCRIDTKTAKKAINHFSVQLITHWDDDEYDGSDFKETLLTEFPTLRTNKKDGEF